MYHALNRIVTIVGCGDRASERKSIERKQSKTAKTNRRGAIDSWLILGRAMVSPRFSLLLLFAFCVVLNYIGSCRGQQKRDQNLQLIERVDDLKKFKALLRTKNNVLVLFSKTGDNAPEVRRLLPIFGDVSQKLYGKATLAIVNCGTEEGKKLCKKLKASPEPTMMKHFNNGDFNKDYDRSETAESMIRFLNDPTGELPWEEELEAKNVLHVQDAQAWFKLIKKEKTPILGMFYAPWCGYCKRLKPEYNQAATDLKGTAVLAGIDVTRAENYPLQTLYNITGFPTLLLFEGGNLKYPFAGSNNTKDGIVHWMKNPTPPSENVAEEPTEKAWADEASEVVHLTDETFDSFLAANPSVLIMFYAPWCGHCKRMKPDLAEAAKQLKEQGVTGTIAAVDATKEKTVGGKFDIKGYPTVKYFKDGKFAWDFHERTTDQIVSFMKDPSEPPPPPPPEQPWSETESDVAHLTVETFKTELKKKKHALIMFYAPWCGHCKAAKPEYNKAAARFKDDQKVMFGAVDCTATGNMEICQQNDVSGYPTFKYFSYLKTVLPYDGQRHETDFVSFIANKIDPSAPASPASKPAEPAPDPWDTSVHVLTPETFQSTLDQFERSLVMFYAPWCGHCKKAKPEFIEAAKLAPSKMGYAAIDCANSAEFCKEKNIPGYPTFYIYANGKFDHEFEGKRTKDAFVNALDPPTDKKEEPAAPAPAVTPDDVDPWESVSKLTPDTFESIVSKADKALVMFYAPWCGHCKNAKPAYIEASKAAIASGRNYVMAAVDCSQQIDLCQEQKVQGYPTINIYAKGEFVKAFTSARSKENFLVALDESLSTPKKEEL